MQRLLLAFAVLLVAAAVQAQAPPATYLNCTIPTSTQTTGLFCGAGLTYAVLSTTNFGTSDTAANAAYTTAVNNVPGASQACKNALASYYCQVSFPRCSGPLQYSRIYNSRCQAVNTACGVTNFPSSPFTGPQCVANSYLTVDGASTVCVSNTVGTLSSTCLTAVQLADPTLNLANTTTVATVSCPLQSTCNGTANAAQCTAPNKLGDACISSCVTGAGQPGQPLACIAGTCQFANKLHGFKCLANAECASNNCTAGSCYNQPLGGACTSTATCRANLYCDAFNSTCYSVALQGEPCGVIQVSSSAVPCAFGFTCVRGSASNSTATCQPNANVGAACATASGAAVYPAPLCAPGTLPTSGSAQCVNSVCTNVLPGAQGNYCDAVTPCATTLTCQYTNATAGTCQTPSSVACDTVGTGCNSYQSCNCAGGVAAKGTCQIDTTNPLGGCAASLLAVRQCSLTSCQDNTGVFYPYDGYSCGATQCLNQINAYFCCVKTAVGASWVPPSNSPPNPCATPSPTPGPTTTAGPTGTATPVPIQSSKRSGAATVAVSFVAMIVAVVAFCL